jgi:hypothetical protein
MIKFKIHMDFEEYEDRLLYFTVFEQSEKITSSNDTLYDDYHAFYGNNGDEYEIVSYNSPQISDSTLYVGGKVRQIGTTEMYVGDIRDYCTIAYNILESLLNVSKNGFKFRDSNGNIHRPLEQSE